MPVVLIPRRQPPRIHRVWQRFLTPWLSVSAAITGSITPTATATDIVAGGKTIVITLTGDTWVAAGAGFDAQRQNIINGLDSAQSEAAGWDAVVKAGLGVAAVVRTSDTAVTITLTAFGTYAITANETITVTVPVSALVLSLVAVIGSSTFDILFAEAAGGGWYGLDGYDLLRW